MRPGLSVQRGDRARRVRDAGVRGVHRLDVRGKVELRPAPVHLIRVQQLVLDADGIHARGEVARRVRSVGGQEDEAAGDGRERLAGHRLEIRPIAVRRLREVDVLGRAVRGPDDPRGVVRCTPDVAELELLERDDVRAASGELVGRRASQRAEADHGDVELLHSVRLHPMRDRHLRRCRGSVERDAARRSAPLGGSAIIRRGCRHRSDAIQTPQ